MDIIMKPSFSPSYGSTVSVAATTSTDRVALSSNEQDSLLITNTGTDLVYVKLGNSTVEASTSDLPILGGSAQVINRGPNQETHMAAITASGSTTVLGTLGYGV